MTIAAIASIVEVLSIGLIDGLIYRIDAKKGTRTRHVPFIISSGGRSGRGAGRAEQVTAQRRIADFHVADHIDQGRLARFEGALERRDDLLVGLDLLAVTSHLRED